MIGQVLIPGSDDEFSAWELGLRTGAFEKAFTHIHHTAPRAETGEPRPTVCALNELRTPPTDGRIAELQALAHTSFDRGRPEDLALLRRFWAAAHGNLDIVPPFICKGPEWKRFGFQQEDPVSDLRASGKLALEQLVWFLEHRPSDSLAMMHEQENRNILVDGYPWATAGINITRQLLNLFSVAFPMGMIGNAHQVQ